MTANYTEACFQAHKRFRSSAIFCFFYSLVLYFKCIYVERRHTHAHARRGKVFGLKLGFCGWMGAMFNAAASRKSCLCAQRWVTRVADGKGVDGKGVSCGCCCSSASVKKQTEAVF